MPDPIVPLDARRTSDLEPGDVLVNPNMVVYELTSEPGALPEKVDVANLVVTKLVQRPNGTLVVLGTCQQTGRKVCMPSFPGLWNIVIPATVEGASDESA